MGSHLVLSPAGPALEHWNTVRLGDDGDDGDVTAGTVERSPC